MSIHWKLFSKSGMPNNFINKSNVAVGGALIFLFQTKKAKGFGDNVWLNFSGFHGHSSN